jgi:hypothetical protein
LGKGFTLASFHIRGTHCCSIDRLNTLVIMGAKSCAKSFHNQYGSPSGPGAVRFSFDKKLITVGSSMVGTRVPTGIGMSWGDM